MPPRPTLSAFVSRACRGCPKDSALPARTVRWRLRHASTNSPASLPKNEKRRSRLLIIAAAGGGIAALAAFSEDARAVGQAAQRTGRVMGTLATCINDYRVTLKHEHDDPADYKALLKACHKRCAERTLVAMEKNGSIFIKLGQHLSSLNYLLPVEWCETFIPLQDKCPVSSFESIQEMILQDTGRTLEEQFSEFEREPIGAASLAQVHRATLRETGERVAVKLQHPELAAWAPLDLKLTNFTFASLKYWFPNYDLTWLSEEMAVSLPQELDFRLEGENARKAAEYFSRIPEKEAPLVIPKVHYADRRILILEYVTGHRPDDLEYLDSHGIDRDEVSAALARIFNEMIFGNNAPLHCDPHGGNIAIRHNPNRGWGKQNFDVVLYDHGLYRTIPTQLRRNYAKFWLAVLEADEKRMRQYAKEVAGIGDDAFPLFAATITGRDYSVVRKGVSGVQQLRDAKEKQVIADALGDGLLAQLVQLLGKVPRVLLLILKTNDLTRSLDENLHTRQGSARTFLILARYASRCVYEESLEAIRGSIFDPTNAVALFSAWLGYTRVELRLSLFEGYLNLRRLFGLRPMEVMGP